MENEKNENEVDLDQEVAAELPDRNALSIVGATALGGAAAGVVPDPGELTTGQGISENTPAS